MAYIREETLDKFTDEELLEIVKKNLDDLGIAYEERPGGFGAFLPLDPADFEPEEEYAESYTIQKRVSGRDHYQRRDSVPYVMGLILDPAGDHIWEDGPAPAAA